MELISRDQISIEKQLSWSIACVIPGASIELHQTLLDNMDCKNGLTTPEDAGTCGQSEAIAVPLFTNQLER